MNVYNTSLISNANEPKTVEYVLETLFNMKTFYQFKDFDSLINKINDKLFLEISHTYNVGSSDDILKWCKVIRTQYDIKIPNITKFLFAFIETRLLKLDKMDRINCGYIAALDTFINNMMPFINDESYVEMLYKLSVRNKMILMTIATNGCGLLLVASSISIKIKKLLEIEYYLYELMLEEIGKS